MRGSSSRGKDEGYPDVLAHPLFCVCTLVHASCTAVALEDRVRSTIENPIEIEQGNQSR